MKKICVFAVAFVLAGCATTAHRHAQQRAATAPLLTATQPATWQKADESRIALLQW